MLERVTEGSCLGEQQEWKVGKIQPCARLGVKNG